MKIFAIVAANVRRLSRNTRSVFIIGLAPLLLIFLLGSAFGGAATTHIDALAPNTPLANQLLRTIARQQGVAVQRVTSRASMRSAVEYGDVEAGVVVPQDYDRALRSGQKLQIHFYAQRGLNGEQVSQLVQSGVAEENNQLVATALQQRERGATFTAAFAHTTAVSPKLSRVSVRTIEPDGKRYPKPLQAFTGGAYTELLLFIFITSLTNSAALVETRRLGISRRMLASPTTVRTVIAGEALGRLALAGIQALLIVIFSSVLFDVHWGNGPAVALVTIAFCLVAAGFGMLLGSTAATEQQALAVGILLGLSLAALGGSMVPLPFFPPIMRDIAHVTPHGWGNEAFFKLLEGDTLVDVLPQIGALAVFAAVAFSLAIWRLRHSLTH